MKPINTNYTEDHLKQVINEDIKVILTKDKEYGRSWLKRGGVGAFMMLARKWDRIEEQVKRMVVVGPEAASSWNIFSHIFLDQRPEGLLDDIRDLRRYLILVEAACLASAEPKEGQPDTIMRGGEGGQLMNHDTTGMEHPFGFDKRVDCV